MLFLFKRLCFLIPIAFLMGCQQDEGGSDSQPAAAPMAMPVSIQAPIKRSVTEWREFTGRFLSAKRVDIRSRVSGYVESIHFEDGQVVERGDVLYVIDPRPYQFALDNAEARYKLAKQRFARSKKLSKNKAIPPDQLDQRQQEVISARADLNQARLDLEFTQVKAPFAGKLGRNLVDEGSLVSGGSVSATHLATLVSVHPIDFYFDVSEADVLQYSRYQRQHQVSRKSNPLPVMLKLHDETEFEHHGVIDFVNNELDQGTGTIQVRAVFDNEDGFLESGLFGKARISVKPPYEALLVPDAVIASELSRKYVLVLGENNMAQRQYVELGTLEKDGMRVIRSGLTSEHQVITSRLSMIRAGMPVTPMPVTSMPAPDAEPKAEASADDPSEPSEESGEEATEPLNESSTDAP